MDLQETTELAVKLMTEYGLFERGWKFEYDFSKCRFGCCKYRVRTISLSATLAILNDIEQVRDVILHEIAHALTPGAKHGERWRAKAKEIGCKPERCYTKETVIQPERAVIYVCPNCKKEYKRFRRSERMKQSACRECCIRYNNGFYLEKFRLQLR